MPNSIYQSTIDLSFEGQRIESERIEYVMIDYRYENVNILPVVYIGLKIPLYLHDEIVQNYQTAKFQLTINRKNTASGSSTSSNHISGSFSYVCSNKEQNSSKKINADGHDDRSYVSTVIGLVSSEMMDSLRSNFNDNYVEESVERLVLDIALGNMGGELIYTPIQYSTEFEQFLVPPTSSRFKLLETIFERYPFYDTYFNFFMDFGNVTYLLDKRGQPVGGPSPDTIVFNITSKEDGASLFPGNRSSNGASVIEVNSMTVKTNVNESANQVANQIKAFDYDTGLQELMVSNSFSGTTPKSMYLKTDNAAVYRNEMAGNMVSVELYKTSVDASTITPNRSYIIHRGDGSNYADYDGYYLLAYKQETYAQSGDGMFNQTCTIGLKKVPDEIVPANTVESSTVSRAFGNGGSKKTSSSQKSNKLTSTPATANDRQSANQKENQISNSEKYTRNYNVRTARAQ